MAPPEVDSAAPARPAGDRPLGDQHTSAINGHDPTDVGRSASPYEVAAPVLWKKGWHGVLPLPAREKGEPPTGWTGWTGDWPSWADVYAWVEEPPHRDPNIGIRLPQGVVGLDFDFYDDKPGRATLIRLGAELGPLPDTVMITSRTDGSGIRLFQVDKDSRFVGGLPGMEVIMHYHRYVVGPGSVHPEGRIYRAVGVDGETIALEDFPSPDDLPRLPPEWVDHLHRKAGGDSTRAEIDGPVQQWLEGRLGANDAPCAEMLAAITRSTSAVPEGSRYDTMVRDQLHIVRLAEQGHAGLLPALERHRTSYVASVAGSRSERAATSEYLRALDGAPGKLLGDGGPTSPPFYLDPCLPVSLLRATSPTAQPPDPDQDRRAPASTGPATGDDGPPTPPAERPLELSRLDQFLATPDDPVKYRIEGLMPAGGNVLIAAQFKAGKSTLVGNLARALVDGTPFLDSFAVHPFTGSVVIIDDELSESQFRRVLRAQGITRTDRVHVISLRGRVAQFDLRDPALFARWVAMLRAAQCSVLIFDCLRPVLDALGLSEDKDAGRFLVRFDALMLAAGVNESGLVHHMGHNGERSRGDSRLRDWPDVEWKILRPPVKDEDGKEIEDPSGPRFFSAFGREIEVAEGALSFDPLTKHLTYSTDSRKDTGAMPFIPIVLQFLKNQVGPVSKATVEKQADGGQHPRAIRDAIALGQKRGWISGGNGRSGGSAGLVLTQDGHAYLNTSTTSTEPRPSSLGTSTPRIYRDEVEVRPEPRQPDTEEEDPLWA